MKTLSFKLQTMKETVDMEISCKRFLVIGYAGRNTEKTMAHIKELEEQIGVPAPKRIPTIYECGKNLLIQDEEGDFMGNKASGEVEYVIVISNGKIYISLGSDHTDRELESFSVPMAKQVCPKPIADVLWDYEEVKDHWDDIRLVSYQTINGEEVFYQEGKTGDILSVEHILREVADRVGEQTDVVIFSGTVPVRDGFRYGEQFRCEMIDDILGRKIELVYNIRRVGEIE